MKTTQAVSVLLFSMAGSLPAFATQTPSAKPVIVSSPDGKVRTELSASDGTLKYRVLVDGKQVLAPSRLGIEADDTDLLENELFGQPCGTL